MARISYTRFRFRRPGDLSPKEYEALKQILSTNPNFNLEPPSSFMEAFETQLKILGAGALGLLIIWLDVVEWLSVIGGIAVFVAFYSLFSFIPSLFSYWDYLADKFNYYSALKTYICKSNNYNEFVKLINSL